ncbi:unnamed protein product [Didymodactylos carnosus]|uniref:Uncharacterized protein n=1 Tax=Didymodactylos carnosus TaxID=1234261 RepID=A0A814AGK1_9BILA|nr:unnamed protein product [Didymodactylos carnosus]CAF0939853.1 unnamed protein product [Didymodactylos carnosus]CAF3693948.1 unnamed protein product [Didymodactylos carnosus]CAF3715155.1 unnamed protein product [Didymodactylos carnosus]
MENDAEVCSPPLPLLENHVETAVTPSVLDSNQTEDQTSSQCLPVKDSAPTTSTVDRLQRPQVIPPPPPRRFLQTSTIVIDNTRVLRISPKGAAPIRRPSASSSIFVQDGSNLQPFATFNRIQLETASSQNEFIKQTDLPPKKPSRSNISSLTSYPTPNKNNKHSPKLVGSESKQILSTVSNQQTDLPPPYISENGSKDTVSLSVLVNDDNRPSLSSDVQSPACNFVFVIMCIIGCLVTLFFTLIILFAALRYFGYDI